MGKKNKNKQELTKQFSFSLLSQENKKLFNISKTILNKYLFSNITVR